MKTKKNAVFAIQLQLFIHYHPQCSCSKVMFSQASVILFTGGRGGGVTDTPQADPQADTPSRQTPLGRHPSRYTPLGRHPPGQTPPGQTSPWSDTPWPDTPCPVHAGMHTLPAQCMLGYTPLPSACWQPLHQMICILLECILVKLMISVHRHFCCIVIVF